MKNFLSYSIISIVFFSACTTLDVYEKTTLFPNHTWASNQAVTSTFQISDTTSLYNLFVVLRHADAYQYKNIYVDVQVKSPDSTFTIKREFTLSDNIKWNGTAIDDIIEHRLSFNATPIKLKKGNYTFTLQQVMREDPLKNIYNAGIRVEKALK